MTTTKLELIRSGVTLDISDEASYIHEENEGFGMPPLHRLTERGPLQDGVSDRGYRLDPRVVNLVITTIGATWSERYTRRAELLRMLMPGNDVVKLRFTDPDGAAYALDCYVISGPLFSSRDMLGNEFKAAFGLYAPDPTLYDETAMALSFGLGGGSHTMLVPTVIPMTVGGSSIDMTQVLNYTGSYRSYPVIRITGPITNCVITNNSTGDKLDFTGVTIGAGAYYEIDCRYGYKTVESNAGVNKIGDLTDDSDLSTFAIEAGVAVATLANSINVAGTSITQATKVDIIVYRRFIGV